MIKIETAIELQEAADRAGVELPTPTFAQKLRNENGEFVDAFSDYTTDELFDWLLTHVERALMTHYYTQLENLISWRWENPERATQLAKIAIYLINNGYIK